MDSESANCNSHFPMNGHNYDHGPPFEILSEIFSHLASDGPLQLSSDMCSSSLDPGIMPQFTAQIFGRRYLSIVSFTQDVETAGLCMEKPLFILASSGVETSP